MKLITFTISALLTATATALPQVVPLTTPTSGDTWAIPNPGNVNNANAINVDNPPVQDGTNDVNTPSTIRFADQLLLNTAVSGWQRDTGIVSNFLNIGPTLTDEETFKNQALVAYSAEIDQLAHKNVLDQFIPGDNNKNILQANQTLSMGSYQLVVDQLNRMSLQGRSALDGIDIINKDRCVNVLPSFDTYFREAALNIGGGSGILQAVRPAACAVVVPGINGALKVGQIPAGYVNGKLQNQPTAINPALPYAPLLH